MSPRRGAASLAEVLLVFTLFALVLTAIAGFVVAQGDIAAAQRDRVRALEVARTADRVLGAELRSLAPADLIALGRDSIRIRGVRGSGVVCGSDAGAVVVGYRGVRAPDPGKDSLLIFGTGIADSVYAVAATARDPRCPRGLRIELDRPAPVSGFALVFETGTYHMSGGAVRYRRGAAGRQPLTEAVLDSAWLEPSRHELRLHLVLDAGTLPHTPSRLHTVRLHMLNGRGVP